VDLAKIRRTDRTSFETLVFQRDTGLAFGFSSENLSSDAGGFLRQVSLPVLDHVILPK